MAEKGVGIELNLDDISFKDSEADIVLRIYRAAKDAGCKFYLGSDAYHPTQSSPLRLHYLLSCLTEYLLAFDDEKGEMRTYRVDRMKDVRYTNIPREGEEVLKDMI